jgi:hypothetical protein
MTSRRKSRGLDWFRRVQVREWYGAVTLLALLLQAHIPVGFMPAADGSGALQLCSGWASDSSGHTFDHDRKHTASICPFAAAASGSLPPQSPSVPALVTFHVEYLRSQGVAAIAVRSGPQRAQSARAPPELS